MISAIRLCLSCGARIPADAPEGGCPGCLLESGLAAVGYEDKQTLTVTEIQHDEVGERDGSCYFSMQFVEGGQLDEVLKRTPMSIRHGAELIAKLARTVQYAHQHGILHRDIKPGNILLDQQGEPHLTDFGLARPRRNGKHCHAHDGSFGHT